MEILKHNSKIGTCRNLNQHLFQFQRFPDFAFRHSTVLETILHDFAFIVEILIKFGYLNGKIQLKMTICKLIVLH